MSSDNVDRLMRDLKATLDKMLQGYVFSPTSQSFQIDVQQQNLEFPINSRRRTVYDSWEVSQQREADV